MSGKLYIKTHGCQMNEYDSTKIADVLLASHRLEITDDPQQADVLLMNTCSIREKAQERCFQSWGAGRNSRMHIHSWSLASAVVWQARRVRQSARGRRLSISCSVHKPCTACQRCWIPRAVLRRPVIDISFPEMEKFDCLPAPRAEGPTAFVSIMEGCSKYCSFCVVPYTRGEEVSRPFDDLIAEVASLATQGVREVTLLGQNVNAYRG